MNEMVHCRDCIAMLMPIRRGEENLPVGTANLWNLVLLRKSWDNNVAIRRLTSRGSLIPGERETSVP